MAGSEGVVLVTKEEGVRDLPSAVKMYFGKALLCERRGEYAEAEEYLQKAVEAEAKLKA